MRPNLTWSSIGLALSLAGPALANDAPAAEALFRSGKSLMDAGDFAQACPKLRESYTQEPATGTLLALALCLQEGGKLASAWATYSEVAARAHQEGRADRESMARERVAALAQRLSMLTVQVAPDVAALPGLVIKRDGQSLSGAGWGVPLPADGGVHLLEATAEGRKPWRQSLTLASEKATLSIDIPLLEVEPASEPAPAPGLSRTAVAFDSHSIAAHGSASESQAILRPLAIVAGGLGLATLAVGSIFGLEAASANRDSKADGHCDGSGCDAQGSSRRNDAFRDATASTALFLVGGALVAGGVTLYVFGSKPGASALALTPSAARSGAGLSVSGGF